MWQECRASTEQHSATYSKLKELAVKIDAEAPVNANESETGEESTAKRSRQDSAIEFILGDSLGNGDDDRSPQENLHLVPMLTH